MKSPQGQNIVKKVGFVPLAASLKAQGKKK